MSFIVAVKNTPSIAGCFRNGLQALGANRALVKPQDPRKCEGSIDIDSCLAKVLPAANRWDYVIGYGGSAYFVEVHNANGNVGEVIKKCTWLRTWLKNEGSELASLHRDGVFHWLATGGVRIGKDRFQLAQNKIVINSLKLN